MTMSSTGRHCNLDKDIPRVVRGIFLRALSSHTREQSLLYSGCRNTSWVPLDRVEGFPTDIEWLPLVFWNY